MTNKTKVTATTHSKAEKKDCPPACSAPSQQQLLEEKEKSLLSLWVTAHTTEVKNGSLLPTCAQAGANPVPKAGSHRAIWAEHSRLFGHLQSSGPRDAKPWELQGWGHSWSHPGHARAQSSALSGTGELSGAAGEKPRAVGECPSLEVLDKREDGELEVMV